MRYTSTIEGDICQYHEVSLADSVEQAKPERILFSQGDGGNLKQHFNDYDVVVVQHALEQSYDPKSLLSNAVSRLNPSGLLIIISDYHYQAKITEKSKWLSGIKVNGENLSGFDALSQQLSSDFDLVSQQELSRVLADSVRRFNLSHCQLTAWRAK